MRTTIFAIAMLLAPSIAAATGCSSHEQAMSCAEGSHWDTTAQACVPSATS